MQVTIDERHGAPATLVDHASQIKKTELRIEKRGGGPAHDEFWCVFDIDEHVNIPAAIDKAHANDINLAITNPCIELWFILHHQDQFAHIERGRAQSRWKELSGCGKNLTAEAIEHLLSAHADATARAVSLDAKHHGDGSPSGSNPSSNLHLLVDRIRRPA